MRRNYLLYIFALLGILAVSCKDDVIERDSDFSESDGRLLSLAVDIPETRTRAIDMTPGAALYLKNIWVGVYDKSDGKRVGGATEELGRMLTASDNTLIDLVSIELNPIAASNDDRYCVVGVANYDGIKVIDPAGGTAADLKSILDNADNWSVFKEIAIDTRNSVFENQVPLLIGYLGKETVTPKKGGPYYTTVNQFVNGNGVNLYGYTNDNDDEVFVSPQINGGTLRGINTKYTEGGVQHNYILKLRRMRSKINVIINEEPVPGITVTNIQYKMCNVPGSAFLAQRRTNTFSAGMSSDRLYSANSADVKYDNNTDGYFDTEFETPDINTNFSFEHFENKHWAKNTEGLTAYHDREKQNNGVFSALAVNAEDWNNMASYFVLKMNIRDDNIGRNAEIEYTIHEGFCNDENGIALTDDTGKALTDDTGNENESARLLDFSCVRNTDYYYKIKINSINDIKVQVTNSNFHTNDQKGKVWDIEYFTDSMIVSSEETEIDVRVLLKEEEDDGFVNSEDIAFRFVGSYYDAEKMKEIPVDICYNFSHGDLDGFSGIWDVPTNESTEYIVAKTSQDGDAISAYESLEAFCNSGSDNAMHFKYIIDDIKVKYGGDYRNIKDYLEIVTKDNEKNPNIDGFKFAGLKYYEVFDGNNDDLRNHIRGLYIFDTQKAFSDGTRVLKDNDGCTYLYKIKGIEQVPFYLKKENYEMIHITGSQDSKIPANVSSKDYTDFSDGRGKNGMLLSESPDFAFRLLGYDGNTDNYYDILYNFTQNEYTALTNDWPQMNLNGIYTSEIAKGALGASSIPKSFLDGLKIIVNSSSEYNIYDFVTAYEGKTLQLSENDKLGFRVDRYDKTVVTLYPERYMRALYLFDKKNKFVIPALYDEAENTATFQVYAAEQYPTYSAPKALDLSHITGTLFTSTNKMNFLDESLDAIRIPVIRDVDPSAYRYKIIVNCGAGKVSECYVDVAPVNGYFNFNIPLKIIAGSSGTIYLTAESLVDDYLDSNDSKEVGSVTLQTAESWDFRNAPWPSRFSVELTAPGATYGKLTFNVTGTKKMLYENNSIRLNNSSSGCDLNFTVYKNCRIKVTGYRYGVKTETINVTPGEPSSLDVRALDSNAKFEFTSEVKLKEDEYSKDITIGSTGGVNLQIVELLEIDD